MAIDYDSGSGLFDKIGPVVAIVNLLDTFETSTSAGNLQKELSDIESALETDKTGDVEALTLLLRKWDNYRQTLHSMKVLIASLTEPLLASEIVSAENLHSDDLQSMLTRLVELLIRDGRKVTSNTVSSTTTPDSPTPTGTFKFYSSVKDNNATADGSAQSRGDVKPNTYRLVCVNTDIPNQAVFSVRGNGPAVTDRGDPLWYRTGELGQISLKDPMTSDNLISNGGFENLSQNLLTGWSVYSGTWNTDIKRDTSDKFRGIASLSFLGDAAIIQTLPASLFRRGGKYALVYSAKKSSTADGSFVIFGGATSTVDISASIFTTSWATQTALFFNVPDNPTDLNVYLSRSNSSAGTLWIDDVAIFPVDEFGGLSLIGIPGQTDPEVDDSWKSVVTNGFAGKFQTFFSRFFDTLLPSYGANSEISDALAG